MKHIYMLIDEPVNENYANLLDYATASCKFVLFVVPPKVNLTDEATEILNKLSPYLHEDFMSMMWPGTRLTSGYPARILIYNLVAASSSILKIAAGRLYEWQQPDRPEDLALLRNDRSVFLGSIAHESYAYMFLDENEKAYFHQSLPQVKIKLLNIDLVDKSGW